MTQLALYESMARALVDNILVGEKNSFPAPLMNHLVKGAVELRMKVGQIVCDDTDGRKTAQRLFYDVTLKQIGEKFRQDWGDGLMASVTASPILSSAAETANWRLSHDFDALRRAVENIEVSMYTRTVKSDTDEYRMIVVAPEFPEWYVYATGEFALPDEKRLAALEITRDQANAYRREGKRLDPDEIDRMYFHLITEVLGPLHAAAETNETARHTFYGWSSFYSLCGIKFDSETIHDLPSFYKEFSIFFCDDVFEESHIPRLRELARQTA